MYSRKGLPGLLALACMCGLHAFGQSKLLSFDDVVARFRANNPDLAAGQIAVEQSRANEITANLRPNPVLSLVDTQLQPFGGSPWRPLGPAQLIPSVSYLFERGGKRQLRTESAKLSTRIANTSSQDLERTLMFSLRDAWNRALQARSVLELAKENLEYYDKVIDLNQKRYRSGDISELDLQRVELQRVQFQSDVVNATTALHTAKIQLLSLMNEHSVPVDGFELAGEFAFRDAPILLPELRDAALESRPDLLAAETATKRAEVDHKLAIANGKSDPTLGFQYQKDQVIGNTIGLDVNVPLRIFDKNQGEKARTALEVRRTGKVTDSLEAAILRDVDSSYEQVQAARNLLVPYQERYLKQATEVRERVSFAYNKGAASLLEFLDAQKTYRDTELAYRNLIGSWMSAIAQLNLAVGKEIVK